MNNENKVLKILFEDSYRTYHIRLLAKLTGLNPNTIITITNKLEKQELLSKNKDPEINKININANNANSKFILKKKFYNINKILNSNLIEFLEQKLAHPTIILFGSQAKAENRTDSDIDIFIIGDIKKELDLSKFEEILGSEIQVFIHTKKEFEKLKKTNIELINNVLNGYILNGFLEVLN